MVHSEVQDIELIEFLDSNKEQGRSLLLPALIKAQKRHGFISKAHAELIGKELKVPLADITGVIEFYSMLYDHPVGETKIGICTSPVCVAKGSNQLLEEIKHKNSTDVSSNVHIEAVACLGLCDFAPAVLIDEVQIGQANSEKIFKRKPIQPSKIYGNQKILTKNCQYQKSPDINQYLESNGFKSLERVLSIPPGKVIEIVKASGLRGRGGAGFPTGIKWEGALKAEGYPKYVVCNMDESEPGTFKDQALFLGDPFKILEGMLVAAYATGAQKGYFYIRGEYATSHIVLEHTISQALQAGYLGKKILGSDFDFDLEIRSGAGAYICGEETALFESIEGKRGFPRIKPPFPTTHGLFGKPTVINNVETFANIPVIFNMGVEEYKNMGSETEPGPRLFSLSGDIVKPGVYEITKPITIRKLIYEYAGGIPNDRQLQAILLGGAAGKFIGPDKIDILLSENDLREHGLSIGSGAVMVFDDRQDMREILASLAHFFAHESCGKCYPCQLGTQRQAEILVRNLNGQVQNGDITRLQDVGWTMTDSSLCGLGQTAALAILSAIDLWPNLFVQKGQSSYE